MDQCQTALQKANYVRFQRAQLRQQVRSRVITARDILIAPPPEVSSLPVCDLLMWTPRLGLAIATRITTRAGVRLNRPVGNLTDRQRQALIDELDARPWTSGGRSVAS